jgi:hypothetical protein
MGRIAPVLQLRARGSEDNMVRLQYGEFTTRQTITGGLILTLILFKDGLRVVFADHNRKYHCVLQSDETITFEEPIQKYITKTLKVSYRQWKARWAA